MMYDSQIVYSVVTEQPDNEPVTLEEAKDHLEYTGNLKDNYINTLISAARRICESYAGLSFVTQERSLKLDRFPWTNRGYIYVPYGPVQGITSITYADGEGTEVPLDDSLYLVDTHSSVAKLFPLNESGERGYWPSDVLDRANALTITYQAGYDDVSGIPFPPEAKIAILRLVARMFEHRGDEGGKDGILDWDTQCILDCIKVTWNPNVCTY